MENTELFGEAHDQEENGLFGKRHQAEQLNLLQSSLQFKHKHKICFEEWLGVNGLESRYNYFISKGPTNKSDGLYFKYKLEIE